MRSWFCVCSFHASPPWMQDNEFILDGYRVAVRCCVVVGDGRACVL